MSDQTPIDGLDTSESRRRILSRIRAAQGRTNHSREREEDSTRNYVAQRPVGPQPDIGEDHIARFVQQSERLSTTIDRAATLDDVPGLVASYLRTRGLVNRAVIWPSFSGLDWSSVGLSVEARAPVRDDPAPDLVGITGCFAAVAETGTLALLSGPETPASMALLPETHIAVVPCGRIVAYMEDAFALLRHEHGQPPRALNFISGPSRTGDIEQTIVLGAHGPYRVHVILVGAS